MEVCSKNEQLLLGAVYFFDIWNALRRGKDKACPSKKAGAGNCSGLDGKGKVRETSPAYP